MYVTFNPDDSEEAMERLEDIRGWMKMNFLKLNDNKTAFMILGRKTDLGKQSYIRLEWVMPTQKECNGKKN